MSDMDKINGGDAPMEDLEKAAILLLSMGEQAAAKVLQRLDRDEVQKLMHCMARLPSVSSQQAKRILQQFFTRYRELSGISGASRDYLERTLDLALGRKLSRNMLDSIYGDAVSEDIQLLQWVPAEVLAKFFRNEHPQMQAVLLAFLPPDTASAVLDALPAEQHDELLFRVANLKEVGEHVIDELRATLDRCITYVAEQSGARVNGVRHAADILNRYVGDRGQMIELLKLHDTGVASEVELNMFDFNTLKRQPQEVLQRLTQDIPMDLLATALKGADGGLRHAILDAMPKRMAQVLETQIQTLGAVSVRRVEQARNDIMQQVRELAEQGELEFQLFEEPVVS